MRSELSCGQTELSWGESLLIFPVKKTGCTAYWDGSGDFRGNIDLRRRGKVGLHQTPEYRIKQKNRRGAYKICIGKSCGCDRI